MKFKVRDIIEFFSIERFANQHFKLRFNVLPDLGKKLCYKCETETYLILLYLTNENFKKKIN